jgi:tetratricopeptide (TPR) repeat protein
MAAVLAFRLVTVHNLAAEPTVAGYVDSKLCVGCHADVYQSYRYTGMARSLFRPGPQNTVEDYTGNVSYYHAASQTYYRMFVRDGAYYQRRWRMGFEGKEENVEELKIDFVLGSGNHARAYLHRTKRGRLIELPLGWYREKGGYWAMSPGYDVPNPATRRNITYECIFCHNAYPHNPLAYNIEPETEPVLEENLPQGIDCQRCHGPGAKHVQAARTASTRAEDLRASIINPARLSAERRMEVCMQCHLETTSGRLPGLIRRFDRGPFTYIPGEPLSDFVLSFDHAPNSGHEGKFEIAGAAYRLRQSQCFLKSGGMLGCETCHNPHNIPHGEGAARYYSARCLNCHRSGLDRLISTRRHTSASNCVTCHMPKRRTEDAIHVAMTDHLIQRHPSPAGSLTELHEANPTEDQGYKGFVAPYYPASLARMPQGELYLAAAQVMQQSNTTAGMEQLATAIENLRPNIPEFYVVLGDAFQRTGQVGKAADLFETASRLSPDSVRILRKLAVALTESGQLSRASEILNQATERFPGDAYTWYELALVDFSQRRQADAIAGMRKAIALDPDLLEPYNGLGVALAANGEMQNAEAAYRDALCLDPYNPTVRGSLARTLASIGNLREAVFHLERAISTRPNYAPDLYDYGLILVRLGRFEDAQKPVEEALKVDPKLAQAHELLGGLFARKKQMDAALHEFQEAVRLQPAFGRAQLDLGATLAGKGDIATAAAHLREAARDPDPKIAQAALRALQQIGQVP